LLAYSQSYNIFLQYDKSINRIIVSLAYYDIFVKIFEKFSIDFVKRFV